MYIKQILIVKYRTKEQISMYNLKKFEGLNKNQRGISFWEAFQMQQIKDKFNTKCPPIKDANLF